MGQETNNEMDLLLRRLGRRQEKPASNGDGHLNHLDADELSAYAENALPAAARARYTEHLAECTRCRELVVSLSGAAGVAVARETVTAAVPSGIKKLLASLFSPMVLRYAAPALGLILIAVVGLIVLRRPEESQTGFMVQAPREEPVQSPFVNQPATQSSPQVGYNAADAPAQPQTKTKSGEQPAPVPNAPPSVSVTATVDQDATGAAAQPMAKESPAAPKKADATDETKIKAEAEARKEEANADRVTVANEAPPLREKASEQSGAGRGQVAELAPGTVQKRALRTLAGAASASSAQRDDTADKDNYAETRTVGGRRFRKEGSIWIDTAYDSSRSIMTLARGSEQFRALVADEPAIKSIADQLDGEFIVVWKGRTYRIR